ncbi:xanthine phosphoribosyltransferase [Anaerotalea alkaliphila]|uniref:Xanthine phosphoribosyltransferase n=1 Tax=Anaerotalea alkaliphila TaxID=2662126 RepID=A0A7X5HVD3_9FIRM|nr:xanthine phosphoribosyltransferase [Anaerotalea alkaliphila]NDL67343.1 xanthine phosphoribosyltransferase [Anaerotalea alkaliphila]
MELLKKRILEEGKVSGEEILRVDSFLNHQMDIGLFQEIGREFHRRFSGKQVTKILTIEASGIGIAAIAALYFQVPVLFAKKTQSRNLDKETYKSSVYSFTKQTTYEIQVSKAYLGPEDHVLILDDFLANGQAVLGLMDIVRQAGATVEGVGIVIEKGFQDGGEKIRRQNVQLESLAVVDRFKDGKIRFLDAVRQTDGSQNTTQE